MALDIKERAMKWIRLPWKRAEAKVPHCELSITTMSDEQAEQFSNLLRKAIRDQGGDVQTVFGR